MPPRPDIRTALVDLTDALALCRTCDMRTPDVFAAIERLAAVSKEQWPHRQFRRALDIAREEDRWQTANAALNGIRLQLPGKI